MRRQYLKTRQVAQVLGVSLNTVYRWLKQERIGEPLRNASNNYRLWTAEDIERIRQQLGTQKPMETQ
jgi:DNA-binding transcriptional MerR regulator